MSNIAAIVDDFARINAQIAQLKKTQDDLKKQLLAIADFTTNDKGVVSAVVTGSVADVVFTKTFPTTFSKDLAQTLLSDIDFQRCFATAINPTITPRVKVKAL